jgi:hypothetical protein
MGSATIRNYHTFEEEDFDIEKLTSELAKALIMPDSVLEIFESEFQCFSSAFGKILTDVEVTANVSFTRGCMYMSNGDPGYPDEEEFELLIDDIIIGEKKFNFQDCLTPKCLERLEIEIWEKAADDGPEEQEYDND